MYRNVVSTRELLSDGFSSERQDSHNLSYDPQQYTQLPYSQPEFSQISSQDMFTQQFSSGSQTETISNASNRKPTLYDKWKSKTTTPFGQVSVNKGNVPVSTVASRLPPSHTKLDLSLQQQFQINKAKAKERDERDFLQQVVNTVQDCTKEVKLTLTSVREKFEHLGEQSEQNLQQTVTSFLDDLWKHQERILDAVQEKDNDSMKYHELEKELALRDAKIRTLEKTIEDHKRETPEKIIRALQKQLHSPQQKVDDKLSELLETTRDNHEQYTQQIQEQRQQLEQQQKLYSELKKSQQTQVKDSEKRLINEVSNLRKDIRKKESSCLQDILDQLKSAQEQQFEELERHINKMLDGSNHMVSDSPRNHGLHKKDIQDLLKRHWEGVEKIVEAQFRKHLKLQEKQLAEVVDKVTEKENRDDQSESFLSLPQFEDKMGQYHDDFKKQVEGLHERHVQELKQLRSEMAVRQEKQREPIAFQSCFNNPVAKITGERLNWDQESSKSEQLSGAERKSEHQFSKSFRTSDRNDLIESKDNQRRDSAIVSPLTANYKKLNTRSFFSKTAFSPVATVLPQRKETQDAEMSTLAQENIPPSVETVPNAVPDGTMKKTKKRKRRSKFSKSKKTKCTPSKRHTQEATDNSELETVSAVQSVNKPASKTDKFKDPAPKSIVPSCTRSNNIQSKSTRSKAVSNHMSQKVTESDKNISVYDFRDDDIPSKFPSKNIPFFGSRTQSYSYNSMKKEIMTVNTSQTVSFPRPNESPCTDSRESSPSLSITEVVVKRRIKCDKRTPDINLHFNPGGYQKLGTEAQFPVYDILSTPTINAVNSQQNKTFWTYKQSVKDPQTVRRAGEKRKLCDINMSNNIIQCLHNQAKRICQ